MLKWAPQVGRGWAHMVRSPVCIPEFDVFFVFDPVQVLVQAVQQEGQQLLTVVLLVTQELRCEVADLRLRTEDTSVMKELKISSEEEAPLNKLLSATTSNSLQIRERVRLPVWSLKSFHIC